jgi:hypothetical protein
MCSSPRIFPALVAALAALCVACLPALAAGPATVTVRVEGVNETLVAPTQLTTTEAPVVNDGDPEHSCSGTSALGALQLATSGHWGGQWYAGKSGEAGQYFVESIAGESFAYTPGVTSYYWSFWVNDHYDEEAGACDVQLESGDRVLFFPLCDEACPAGPSPTPLEIEVPTSAEVGEPITAIVRRYEASGESSPAAGAKIEWASASAITDAQGDATLSFPSTGTYTLHVSGSSAGPPTVRTEASVCVHNGNDGSCGTPTPLVAPPSGGVLASKTAAPPVPYEGPYALVASVSDPLDGHTYSRAHAPRLLAGMILAHSAVTSVRLELRREYHGRCYAYDGTSGRFVRARCGTGSPFAVSRDADFSYLLPERLRPGRYVLDVHASDAAGNATTLARGTSRIVFYVR